MQAGPLPHSLYQVSVYLHQALVKLLHIQVRDYDLGKKLVVKVIFFEEEIWPIGLGLVIRTRIIISEGGRRRELALIRVVLGLE